MNKILKKGPKKQKAVVFVDYEYWYYSYKNLYHMTPNPGEWYEKLSGQYEIMEMLVFGAFEQEDLKLEMPRIRAVTNTIISTDNQGRFHKKDMTDFIMLDYIYQRAMDDKSRDIYILFTGDGHFQAVTRFLIQRFHKDVVVCGVRNAFSRQLQETATRTIELPAEKDVIEACYPLIVENFSYIADHPEKGILPTFRGTVSAVSRTNGISEAVVHTALQQMLEHGYLNRKDYRVEFNRKIKVIVPDWEKLHDVGLWDYPE